MSAPSRHRLFFALWPDARARDAVAGAARTVAGDGGGRAVAHEHLHLTLAFLHSVEAPVIDALRDVARGLVLPAMTLHIDRVGYFRRPRVLWLAPSRPPQMLLAFERRLWEALLPLGFERRHAQFRPHVTVSRDAPAPAPDAVVTPFDWRVTGWALVESSTGPGGARYRPLDCWPAAD